MLAAAAPTTRTHPNTRRIMVLVKPGSNSLSFCAVTLLRNGDVNEASRSFLRACGIKIPLFRSGRRSQLVSRLDIRDDVGRIPDRVGRDRAHADGPVAAAAGARRADDVELDIATQ